MSLLAIIGKMCRAGFTAATPNTYFGAALDGVVWDENPLPHPQAYGGFPYGDLASDKAILSSFKVAHNHGESGPLTFSRSVDGGVTEVHQQIVIDGVPQICSAVVMKVLASGRILIIYQDNPGEIASTYQDMKTAFSDNQGATWHQGGAWDWNTDESFKYGSSIYGRPIQLPSGKVLMTYYSYPRIGGIPSLNGILESVDEGETWTQGAIIASHRGMAVDASEPFLTETGWCIVEHTGVDSTTKLIAFIRNEEGTAWVHFRSPDGGATWQKLTGTTMVSNVEYSNWMLYDLGTSHFSRYPVDVFLFEGRVYVVALSRLLDVVNQFEGRIEYISATVADAYNNSKTGWSARTVVPYTCQAQLKNASLDFGYGPVFLDADGNLISHFYDASNSPDYVGGTQIKQCMIYQIQIKAKTP